MDTLTHALSGALLARLICVRRDVRGPTPGAAGPVASGPAAATAGRFSAAWDRGPGHVEPWQAMAVGAAAAAFPDLDFVAQLGGDFFYLRHHRAITHSVLLAPLWAALIAVVMARWFAVTRTQPGGWKGLYLIALGGVWLHIAGDWITQFGTLLLAPLSDRRFGLGAVFIVDLVLSGILLAALGVAAWQPRRRWPAALGLAATCGWVQVCWTGKQEAEAAALAYARERGINVAWVDSAPRPASPFNWTLAIFDGEDYHVADINTRRREPLVATEDSFFVRRLSAPYLPVAQARWERRSRPGGAQAPAWVRAAWEHEALATLRWFAGVPALVQWLERQGADGQPERCAVFGDLRYSFPGRGQRPFTYALCLAGAGSSGSPGSGSAAGSPKVRLWRAATDHWAPL